MLLAAMLNCEPLLTLIDLIAPPDPICPVIETVPEELTTPSSTIPPGLISPVTLAPFCKFSVAFVLRSKVPMRVDDEAKVASLPIEIVLERIAADVVTVVSSMTLTLPNFFNDEPMSEEKLTVVLL